jgi:hypothetical protein
MQHGQPSLNKFILNPVTHGQRSLYSSIEPIFSNKFFIKSIGQKFHTNWFVENFIQPTYKIDMCLLTCEKHMLF